MNIKVKCLLNSAAIYFAVSALYIFIDMGVILSLRLKISAYHSVKFSGLLLAVLCGIVVTWLCDTAGISLCHRHLLPKLSKRVNYVDSEILIFLLSLVFSYSTTFAAVCYFCLE